MAINMNEMMEIGLNTLKGCCEVNKGNTYNYDRIKLNPLFKFNVQRYDIENIGNLSIMTMNMGVMKMSTFIITPYLVDLPMFSSDFMYIMSNRKTYLEFYDLTTNKNTTEYQSVLHQLQKSLDLCKKLKDFDHKICWYENLITISTHKGSKKKQDEIVKDAFVDLLTKYIELAKDHELTQEDRIAKWKITQQYCKDMVEKGGVSTDMFKKYKGEEFTLDFFCKVLFGTENYK